MKNQVLRCATEMSDSFRHKLVLSFPLLVVTRELSSRENLSGASIITTKPVWSESPRSCVGTAAGCLLTLHLLRHRASISPSHARTISKMADWKLKQVVSRVRSHVVGAGYCYTPPGIAYSLRILSESGGRAMDKRVAVRCRELALDLISPVACMWRKGQPPYTRHGGCFVMALGRHYCPRTR